MTEIASQTTSDITVDHWLAESGFLHNPFAYLDASTDPRINAYLVGHGAFAAMWGHWPSVAFAPAGGGKTALRMQVTRACWAGPDTGYPFPISYIPTASDGKLPGTLDEHLIVILQSAALSLLQALGIRPHWWEGLDNATHRTLRALLDRDLPVSLAHYLAQAQDALLLASQDSSSREQSGVGSDLSRWTSVAQQLTATPASTVSNSPLDRLRTFAELLLGPLGFSAVYLLVDGVDGFPETADSPAATAALLDPLMSRSRSLGEDGIFLKGFFPTEAATALADSISPRQSLHQVTIAWSPQLLAEVLRQRIYVATAGEFGSLDAISAPGLRDAETRIARAVKPLPREMLVLVNRLIWERVHRSGNLGQLNEDDLQAAIEWYEAATALGASILFASKVAPAESLYLL